MEVLTDRVPSWFPQEDARFRLVARGGSCGIRIEQIAMGAEG
jgi:hypothetical protein